MPEFFMVLAAADAVDAPTDVGKMIGGLVQYGVLGLVVTLFLTGTIVPKATVQALSLERDNWRDAHQKEHEAHQATLVQLAKAQTSADVATEQGRAMVKLLEDFGHRPDTPRST
ncbi:hypothetical protein ACFO9E_18110 [Streptomyces maoxianensis]|uniref:Uncharacterized protein n=1 Tax=Streptomyces maoxianensis TaxID=1459942 RepID=A0ABV9G972_9ACTN